MLGLRPDCQVVGVDVSEAALVPARSTFTTGVFQSLDVEKETLPILIGGILILLLFGIMLTTKITSVRISHTNVQRGVGALIVLAIFAGLVWMINLTPWLQISSQEPQQTVHDIGTLLMTDFLLPFEVASVLLLGALIGAAVLARKES